MELAMAEPTDILRHLPKWMSRSGVGYQPGGLPVEIWYLVIFFIEDPRMLFVCAFTCKILAARVFQMLVDGRDKYPRRPDGLLDMHQMYRYMRINPLVCYILTSLSIPTHSMSKFIYECTGKLRNLERLEVHSSAERSPQTLPFLRLPLFKAASRFPKITSLHLYNIVFYNYCDFSRLVCLFPALCKLIVVNISWQRGEGYPLSEGPFTQHPYLQDITVC
ncbi:hypothetical protein OBBRIDRAFT_479630 [Obba rivulosa]|uniref:Uncharacterized protein n=1 Tax=Obba rivulosa TaxID=1052685 RepID=A0A8E2B449_9APHY|nr:hypothetical protein OBBRIDRAFT_479630 [Obba rivulosa]